MRWIDEFCMNWIHFKTNQKFKLTPTMNEVVIDTWWNSDWNSYNIVVC